MVMSHLCSRLTIEIQVLEEFHFPEFGDALMDQGRIRPQDESLLAGTAASCYIVFEINPSCLLN